MKIAALRQEFQIEPQDKVISLIARLYKSKGQQYLIEAAPRIVERFPQVHFLLVGDGPHENLLRQRIQELRLTDHFIFSGYRQDIPEMIAISDIVVRPSEMEGLPINVIEAMLMAKPVVASRIAGVPEMIEHGVNGLMAEVGDVASLAEHILLLLTDEDRRVEMGLAARNTALEKFSIESCVGKTEALYFDRLKRN
nr:glycosyltransferase [Sporomusa sphaeroides]